MVSIERWKEQYKCLASQSYPNEDVYIVPQSGRGLGRNAYPKKKTLYKIKKPSVNSTKEIQIVSPVAASIKSKSTNEKKSAGNKKKTLKSGAEV